MFVKCAKKTGAETPRFRKGTPAPAPRPLCSLRPCLADGKPATFHRWVEEDGALLHINAFVPVREQQEIIHRFREDCVVDNSAKIEKIRTFAALVEYADGSVGRVKPELIQFLDRKEV